MAPRMGFHDVDFSRVGRGKNFADWVTATRTKAACHFIRETLFPIRARKKSIFNFRRCGNEMNVAVRNFGQNGIASSAIAAVEIALWDLKAKLLNLPLAKLLGAVREKIPVYGSGGFTSYSEKQLRKQFENWVGEGISMVKMKIGREPNRDETRVQSARKAIGKQVGIIRGRERRAHAKAGIALC